MNEVYKEMTERGKPSFEKERKYYERAKERTGNEFGEEDEDPLLQNSGNCEHL